MAPKYQGGEVMERIKYWWREVYLFVRMYLQP